MKIHSIPKVSFKSNLNNNRAQVSQKVGSKNTVQLLDYQQSVAFGRRIAVDDFAIETEFEKVIIPTIINPLIESIEEESQEHTIDKIKELYNIKSDYHKKKVALYSPSSSFHVNSLFNIMLLNDKTESAKEFLNFVNSQGKSVFAEFARMTDIDGASHLRYILREEEVEPLANKFLDMVEKLDNDNISHILEQPVLENPSKGKYDFNVAIEFEEEKVAKRILDITIHSNSELLKQYDIPAKFYPLEY